MKKYLALFLLALLCACTRQPREPRLVEITFNVADHNSGRLLDLADTKACPEPGFVADALAASTPTEAPTITLTSKTNSARVYEVVGGQTATVAIDSYYAIGECGGSYFETIYTGKSYDTAKYEIMADDVTIIEQMDAVTLPAEYSVFSLVYDRQEVKEIQLLNGGGKAYFPPDKVGGDDKIGVIFLDGQWTGSNPLKIKVIPNDTVNFTEKTYSLSYNGTSGTIKVRKGCWYYFGPEAVAVTEGVLNVILPEWENGNE